MKKMLFLLAAMMVIFSFGGTAFAAAPKGFDAKAFGMAGNFSVIQELSGKLLEGERATVRLVGKHEKNSQFYDGFWLEVTPEKGKSFVVPLRRAVKGYAPRIEARNFVSPGRAEIFMSLDSGGSGGLGNYFVMELTRDRRLHYLFDSGTNEAPQVIGSFMDEFRAEVSVVGAGVQSLVDLISRRDEYEKQGVYAARTGKLKNPVNLMGGGYSALTAIDSDNNGIDELRGVQQMSGTSHADRIASVVYTMAYRDGKWELLNARIEPAEGLTLMRTPRTAK